MKNIYHEIDQFLSKTQNINHPIKDELIDNLEKLKQETIDSIVTEQTINTLNELSKDYQTAIAQINLYEEKKKDLEQKRLLLTESFISSVEDNSNLYQNTEILNIIEDLKEDKIESLVNYISSDKLKYYPKYYKKLKKLLEKYLKAQKTLQNLNIQDLDVQTITINFQLEDFIKTSKDFSIQNTIPAESTTIESTTTQSEKLETVTQNSTEIQNTSKLSRFLKSKFTWATGLALSLAINSFQETPKRTNNKPRDVMFVDSQHTQAIEMGFPPNTHNQTIVTSRLEGLKLTNAIEFTELHCNLPYLKQMKVSKDIIRDYKEYEELVKSNPQITKNDLPALLLKDQIFWSVNKNGNIQENACVIKTVNSKLTLEEINIVEALTNPLYSSYQWSTLATTKEIGTRFAGIQSDLPVELKEKYLKQNFISPNLISIDQNQQDTIQAIKSANSTTDVMNIPHVKEIIKNYTKRIKDFGNFDILVANFKYTDKPEVTIQTNPNNTKTARLIINIYQNSEHPDKIILDLRVYR